MNRTWCKFSKPPVVHPRVPCRNFHNDGGKEPLQRARSPILRNQRAPRQREPIVSQLANDLVDEVGSDPDNHCGDEGGLEGHVWRSELKEISTGYLASNNLGFMPAYPLRSIGRRNVRVCGTGSWHDHHRFSSMALLCWLFFCCVTVSPVPVGDAVIGVATHLNDRDIPPGVVTTSTRYAFPQSPRPMS